MSNSNCFRLNSQSTIKRRIICITHSGSYASQYAVWEKYLPNDVECVIYERPGSGTRLNEEFCLNWEILIRDAVQSIAPYLDLPYILFGHSLGGSIAFEVAKELEKSNKKLPAYVALGDREAPNFQADKLRHHLSDEEFGQMLIADYGMAKELVESPEIMEFFLPMLKHDFWLADTYYEQYGSDTYKIKSNITVFRPDESNDLLESQLAWQNFSTGEFKLITIQGDHFFVFKHAEDFMQKLVQLFNM
jgi:medium-chain acyl-[acyl-carrier-protein] hydrolase